MSTESTLNWHKAARPNPTAENFNVQLGCHLEELVEMVAELRFHSSEFGSVNGNETLIHNALDELATRLKSGKTTATIINREAFLDSLADQIVTDVGVAHTAGMDIDRALNEVNRSNWSKFTREGLPIFNEAGKIIKGPDYSPPDLTGMY